MVFRNLTTQFFSRSTMTMLGIWIAFTTATAQERPTIVDPNLISGLQPPGMLPEERVNLAVYAAANRGVVHIETRSAKWDAFLGTTVSEGSGSGSVLDFQGHIVTNQHVIDGAREISVRLYNGQPYDAQLVGQDAETDIAVLRIDAPRDVLVPIPWGESTGLAVGHRIYAIGNPFGLERTMSRGMISSLNRQIPSSERRTMRSLIQIDASINQGNSGGPLLNTMAQLVGMNTAIVSNNGDSAGVGFAIPVSTLRRIVPQLIANGKVLRPTIGISRVYETERGLLVVTVASGGPAEQAGVQGFRIVTRTFRQGPYTIQRPALDPSSADIITAVDGTEVATADDLLAAIDSKRPGDVVNLTIIRGPDTLLVPVTLGGPN